MEGGCLLTYAGVPPEDVPVKDVEGKMPEATWDLAVEVLAIEGTEQRSQTHLIRPSDRLLRGFFQLVKHYTESVCHYNPSLLPGVFWTLSQQTTGERPEHTLDR